MLDRWFRPASRAALALLVAVSLPARADDSFTVSGVHEDVTAASALAARDQAQAAGQAKAFAVLMDRVAAGKAPHLGAAEITDLVIGFEVANERTSTVRYTADYTFHFNPAAVRRLLEGGPVATAAAPQKPVVVLPVFVVGGRAVLWDDPNPWRDAWAEGAAGQKALPVVVPAGDLPDVAAIDAPKAIAGDRAALNAIASRYGNDDVLVAAGRFAGQPGRFEINAVRYSASGPGQTLSLLTTARPGETEAAQLARSVAYVAAEVGQAVKPAGGVDARGGGSLLDATVTASSLADWIAVRNRLRTIGLVRSADLVSFDREQIRVAIRYVGDPQQLRAALGEHGLELGGAAPDWTLALQAPPLAPALPPAAPAAGPGAPAEDPPSPGGE